MPSGNGARAQQKRERNMAKQSKGSTQHSQLKDNQKAMNITCSVCKQPFMNVTSSKSLKDHSDNKHPKLTFKECFPTFEEPNE